MGLDTSHNCFHGSYLAFHAWRQYLAHAVGIDLDQMQGFQGGPGSLPIAWNTLPSDPIHILLDHSDNEGVIKSSDCGQLADRLELLLPVLHNPHCKRRAVDFIAGLRLAASRGEDVEFR